MVSVIPLIFVLLPRVVFRVHEPNSICFSIFYSDPPDTYVSTVPGVTHTYKSNQRWEGLNYYMCIVHHNRYCVDCGTRRSSIDSR